MCARVCVRARACQPRVSVWMVEFLPGQKGVTWCNAVGRLWPAVMRYECCESWTGSKRRPWRVSNKWPRALGIKCAYCIRRAEELAARGDGNSSFKPTLSVSPAASESDDANAVVFQLNHHRQRCCAITEFCLRVKCQQCWECFFFFFFDASCFCDWDSLQSLQL